MVANLDPDIVHFADDRDTSRTAAGVTVDIGEALLDDPEDCGFQFGRQASDLRIQLKIHVDFASRGKSLDIPTHS
jgi:hypothetical protein